MGFNVKTIIKLFAIFLFFQISINFLIEVIPEVRSLSLDDENYLIFLADETNLFDGEATGRTLLDDFVESLETENLFNDSIIESFLGALQIIGQLIRFVIEIALLILITPSIIINILLFNFVGSSSILFSMSLILNILFYMILFYIVLRGRTRT